MAEQRPQEEAQADVWIATLDDDEVALLILHLLDREEGRLVN